jgi:hypothetical protein
MGTPPALCLWGPIFDPYGLARLPQLIGLKL